jgi:hypothetical protein
MDLPPTQSSWNGFYRTAAVGFDVFVRSSGRFFEVALLIQDFAFENCGIEMVIYPNWIAFFVSGEDFRWHWRRLYIENASIKSVVKAEDLIISVPRVQLI